MNNIKYPIIFINKQELQEAKEFGIINFKSIDSTFDYPYMLTHYNGGQNFNTWRKTSVLINVQDASFWSEIRKQYLPTIPWYDTQSKNGGKIVWVRNSNNNNWAVDIFRRYDGSEGNSFICETNYWKYAKPIQQNDLIKEHNND